MTTTYAGPPVTEGFDPDVQAKIDSTLVNGVAWRAFGQAADGKQYFVTFGAPEVSSRDSVKFLAEKLFERHSAHPVLVAIRPNAKGGSNWVLKGKISGKLSAHQKGLAR